MYTDWLLLTDSLIVVYVSPSLTEFLGSKRDVLLGERFTSFVHPGDRDCVRAEMPIVGSSILGGISILTL